VSCVTASRGQAVMVRSVKSGYGMESCGLVRRSRLVMVRQGEETFGD